MDVIKDLYKVLILFSAGVILLGMILNLRLGKRISSSMKMLLILAVVNLASMMIFLFNLKSITNPDITVAIIFIDSVILILNMIIGRYVFELHTNKDTRFDHQIKHLFLTSFICECIFLVLIFVFRTGDSFFDTGNIGFPFLFSLLSILLIWGSVIPGVKAFLTMIRKRNTDVRIHILLILNMINNTIGVFMFSLRFPDEKTGLLANMIINIICAYYYGYYMISSYFESRKNLFTVGLDFPEQKREIYSWNELKKHLSHWSETKAYLDKYHPEIITMAENFQLSDLEKIHFALKLLKIKSKEIAEAMNITTRAVEMQRYRISKKLSKDSER